MNLQGTHLETNQVQGSLFLTQGQVWKQTQKMEGTLPLASGKAMIANGLWRAAKHERKSNQTQAHSVRDRNKIKCLKPGEGRNPAEGPERALERVHALHV